MAATILNPTKLGRNSVTDLPALASAAADTSIGSNKYIVIPYGRDDKLVLEISASSADTVKILKGNGYAAADEDLEVLSAATGSKVVVVETAKYGIDGKIIVDVAGANGKCCAMELM